MKYYILQKLYFEKVMEGLYKMIVEAIMIASLEIIILMFVIVLELFPSNLYKNYKYNF